jgi:ketosteroid isomerase-like protein
MGMPMTVAAQGPSLDSAQRTNGCPVSAGALPTRRWIQDMREKNLADVTVLFTEDVVFVDPGGETFRGLTEVRGLYAKVFATFDSEITFAHPVLFSSRTGHSCIETGRYEEDLRERGSGEVSHCSGQYRFVYRLVPKLGWHILRQEWTVTDQKGTKS